MAHRIEKSPFASSDVHSYDIQGESIVLKHHPDVFTPSAFGLRFAQCVDFRAGERAADIGTGTGIHAVLAARRGAADVLATDLCETAVSVARYNAHTLNRAPQITVKKAAFFGDARGPFDVITANLPQEIVAPAHMRHLSSEQIIGVDGQGEGGNLILLEFLDIAADYMHDRSRLYIIVNTITDYKSTLAKIDQRYDSRVLWSGTAPTKPFVADNIDHYRGLLDRGMIDIFTDEHGRWIARQYIYELRRAGGRARVLH